MNKDRVPLVCTECKRIIRHIFGCELTRAIMGSRKKSPNGTYSQYRCRACANKKEE